MITNAHILLEQRPYVPVTFEALHPNVKGWLTPEKYAESEDWYKKVTDVTISTIVYLSDNLKVHGILVTPKHIENKKWPVVIFNRGGGDGEGVTLSTLQHRIYPLINAGYVVIASHYRGAVGSEGVDELGGADVQDIVALFEVIKELNYADTNNIFMLGFSRGGLMAYCALAQQVPANAVATIAGAADLFMFEAHRPDAIPLLEHMIPGYKTNHDEEMTKRSATKWANKINAPLLLLHGDNDAIIDIQESEELVRELKKYKKVYKFIPYSNCNHFFQGHLAQAYTEILAWFKQYKK